MFALLINRVDRHKYYQNTRPFLLVQSEAQYGIAHPLRGGVPVRTTARWSEQYRWMVSTYTAPLIEQYWSIGWCYSDCERCVVCGVLKKVDSGTGKLGYGFTDSVH